MDATHGSGSDAVTPEPPPDPCAAAPAYEVEARITFDPIHVGFAPSRVVVFGAGLYLPLFQLEGSGEGSDTVGCSAVAADAGVGASAVRVDCQDGPLTRSATLRLEGDRLDLDIAENGTHSERSEPVKPCARRLIIGDLTLPETGEPSLGRHCPQGSGVRAVDGFLRRGQVDRKTGTLPLFLEVPALGLRPSIGKAVADPDRCTSEVTPRGWAYVKCGAGEDASYAKVVPLPGEVVIDRSGVGHGPRQRIPIPCDVRLVLHDVPCVSDCPEH
jgi:hypothetical protein